MIPMWHKSAVVTELIDRGQNAMYEGYYPSIQVDNDEQTISLNCEVVFRNEKRFLEVVHGEYWMDDSNMRTLTWDELSEIENIINN